MKEIDLSLVRKRIKSSVLILISRTAFLQLLTFISTFILTILLKPEVFGIFFVVSSVIAFLSYFSDIGLAAALVQKKEEVTSDDLKTVFTIQLILVLLISILAYFLSNLLASFYQLNGEGLWLLRVLIIAFFLSSLKTIPSILLERRLEFNLFVIPQIIEHLFFYISVVILAWLGLGVTSFTIGVLLRSISGLIAIYILVPWLPALGINKQAAKKLLSFGVPFQVNSLMALIKDDLLTIYLGKAVGFSGIGFVGWAKKWSEMPLRLVMDNINKVAFPAFARLQDDKKELTHLIEKALFFVVLLTLPFVLASVFLIDILIEIIPKYNKWEPALYSFYLFSFGVVLSSISSLLVNMIQALGKVKVVLKLMIMWTALTWLLVPIFIKFYAFNGVAVAMFIISFTAVVPMIIAKRLVDYRLIYAVKKPLIIGFFTAFAILIGKFLVGGPSFFQLLVAGFCGIFAYLVMLFLLARKEIRSIFLSKEN